MNMRRLLICICVALTAAISATAQSKVWSTEQAQKWGKENPWYCGVNYIPANAINYTAMWDKTSFSPEVIEKEMKLMKSLGMNCARVVMQYAVYEEDPAYFIRTLDRFLSICDKYGVKVMPIFFDDCAFGERNRTMDMNLILASIGVFLVVMLLLVVILLVAKNFLVPSGNVKLTINGDNVLDVESGATLLNTLSVNGVFLSSACGGKGSCGQCKCQVLDGGGEILPSEVPHFSRKQVQDHWRLGCQVKVKSDMAIKIDESVLGVKEWECEVISNKNVATFIKEFIVALPKGEHMDFIPGSYAQIKIPKYSMDYNKDIDKSLIGDEYLPAWEKFGLFTLKCDNNEETIRAYSMANYPAEGDRIMLTVRIATPPFKPKDQGQGFMDVPAGIASSYIFTLKPGDKVIMSGPYGDFHPIFDSKKEMMWIGGGAGMAPLRAQIMHLTKTLHTTDRVMNYFYGARALNEVFYLEDFLQIEKDFPNFTFHLALDRPDPAADAAGVKYTPGFVHNVIYETYLKNHEAPEDIEYYMCGPGPMSKAVEKMLDDLGVPAQNLMFDNFGG